jgi:UDP-glucose 4-epimerase
MAVQGDLTDFRIHGDDFETPDGTAVRDYIHVADLATAHVLAVRALLKQKMARTYNLGTGTGYSVKEIINEISRVSETPVNLPSGSRRPGDPAVLIAEATLAKKDLGWEPQLSDLKTIVETAWRWHEQVRSRRTLSALRGPK